MKLIKCTIFKKSLLLPTTLFCITLFYSCSTDDQLQDTNPPLQTINTQLNENNTNALQLYGGGTGGDIPVDK